MLFPVLRLGYKSVTVGAFAWPFLYALVPDSYEAAVAERTRPIIMSMITTLFGLATLVTLTFLPAVLVTVLRLQRRVAA